MNKKIFLPILLFSSFAACTQSTKDLTKSPESEHSKVTSSENKNTEFPIRIGVLADSQITTDKGTHDYGMRKKLADKLASVAIRPVAVEYLAHSMLNRFLDKLKEEHVDMILYLGDGANSGCKDELDTIFSSLEKFRDESNIPSYYVIGNHDYLGAGNQTNLKFRKKLCSNSIQDNPAEPKEKVIQRIIDHNNKSASLDKNFSYYGKKTIYSKVRKRDGHDNDHYNMRYIGYLSGNSSPYNSLEIMLLDTSDYHDVTFKADAPGTGGFWGTKGSISYDNKLNDSQVLELQNLGNANTNYRVIASHYMPDNMDAVIPWSVTGSLVKDALGNLLSKGENIWISAHTHTEFPEPKKHAVGKTLSNQKGSFDGINVGSTTDYKPHAIVVGANNRNNKIGDSSLGYTTISYYSDEEKDICNKILISAKEYESSFSMVCGKNDYLTVLGLDTSYKRSCFKETDIKAIQKNIDKFSQEASKILNITQSDVNFCLAYTGSKNEGPR